MSAPTTVNFVVPLARIALTVVDSSNTPVPGVQVSINANQGSVNLGSSGDYSPNGMTGSFGTTGTNGVVDLTALIGAVYTVSLTPPQGSTTYVHTTIQNATFTDLESVTETIGTAVTVSGTVKDSLNTALNGVQVGFSSTSGSGGGSGTTDPSGNYSAGVLAGTTVHTNIFGNDTPTGYAQTNIGLNSQNTFTVSAPTTVNFVVPLARVAMRVDDSAGDPVPGIQVSMYANQGSVNLGSSGDYTPNGMTGSSGTTGTNGVVDLTALIGAIYTVQLTPPQGSTTYVHTTIQNATFTDLEPVTVVITSAAPVLRSIAVTPANPVLVVGATRQLVATGTFSDGSTGNITDSVAWASLDTASVTVSAAGLATAVATGSSTVNATSGSVSGGTTVTVSAGGTTTGVVAVDESTTDVTGSSFHARATVNVAVPQPTKPRSINTLLILNGQVGSVGALAGTVTFTLYSGTCQQGHVIGSPQTVTLSDGQARSASSGPLGAGSYSYRATFTSSSPDYAGSTSGCTSFVVHPARLTITASSGSMSFGGQVPAIRPLYSGFVAGFGPSTGFTSPSCGTDASSSSAPGKYRTFCSGAADVNYSISYVAGTISIRKASTATTLTTSSDPSESGRSVTLTARVATADAHAEPAGVVLFAARDASGATVTVDCGSGDPTATLAQGVASCTLPSGVLVGALGPYRLTATYQGNLDFSSSAASRVQDMLYAVVTITYSASSTRPGVGTVDTLKVVASNASYSTSSSGAIVVTDQVPAGFAYRSSSTSVGQRHLANGKVTWSIPNLDPGSSATLTIVAVDRTTRTTQTSATYTSATPDADGATTGSSNILELVPSYAQLGLVATVSDANPAVAAADVFSVRVTNRGPDSASGVVVTDRLPTNASLLSVRPSAGSARVTSLRGVRSVVWTVGNLGVGRSATLDIELRMTTAGTVLVRSESVTTSFDPSGGTKHASASAIVVGSVAVPSAHTGEPWSGWWYWGLVTLVALAGALSLTATRRRAYRLSRPSEN